MTPYHEKPPAASTATGRLDRIEPIGGGVAELIPTAARQRFPRLEQRASAGMADAARKTSGMGGHGLEEPISGQPLGVGKAEHVQVVVARGRAADVSHRAVED